MTGTPPRWATEPACPSAIRGWRYATCDEANTVIGLVLALGQPSQRVAEIVRSRQNDLYDVGADLVTPHDTGHGRTVVRRAARSAWAAVAENAGEDPLWKPRGERS